MQHKGATKHRICSDMLNKCDNYSIFTHFFLFSKKIASNIVIYQYAQKPDTANL